MPSHVASNEKQEDSSITITPPKFPDSKVHVANMEPIGGRQDPGGPHVSPMNFSI